MEFLDQSRVDFVCRALWQYKPMGRAAVMVGSGFSRNARPTSPSSRPMPQWSDMASALCHQLYPESDRERHTSAMQEAQATSGFLRLAQEFEAVFGRLALYEKIRALVPNSDYEPDDLHRRLLSLPWADVFTTNWDTLLERTRRDVFERSYDIVHTPSEIPVAARPRIVKLHGSLPAHEPFIFTEEDFRTYPTKFASFVNLVQQSMMETVFCLIGFSGDDPNFLHWSGWVRDNLGTSAPKIHLVGWLDLSPHRRRMLEDRNVVPIDLAFLPQAAQWPDHARRRYAIEWFLCALELGRPTNASQWPSPPPPSPSLPSYLGCIPSPTVPVPRGESSRPDDQRELQERLTAVHAVAKTWRWNRKLYPGWLVAPSKVRSVLWSHTREWLSELCEMAPHFPPGERLLVLRELIWRLDTALVPLDDALEDVCAKALKTIDVQRKLVLMDDGMPENRDDVQWSRVCKAGETLAIALVRCARERGDKLAFDNWLACLAECAAGTAEVDQHVAYEQCLWALARLDYEALDNHLAQWNPEKTDPVWALRKAGILAEITRNRDAISLLRDALTEIRRHRRRDLDDLPALSREAWALWLVGAYRHEFPSRDAAFADTPEPIDRWRELAIYHCDAYSDYNSLLAELEKVVDDSSWSIIHEPVFDLGQFRTSVRFTEGIWSPRVLASYQMLRLAEVTGLPHAANHVLLLDRGLRAAADMLADMEPWSVSLRLVRRAASGSDKALQKFFTRSRIALYSTEHIERLKEVFIRQIDFAFPYSLQPADASAYRINRLAVSVEVLSRITLRFSAAQAGEILERAMAFYRSDAFVRNPLLTGPLQNLFKRAIEILLPEELCHHLPVLFDLPLLSANKSKPFSPGLPDPVNFIPDHRVFETPANAERAPVWTHIVARLIQVGEGAESEARKRALYRLARLHSWGLLGPDEQTRFATVLWCPDELDPSGLPRDHGLEEWVFLILPESTPGQAEAAFRAKYLSEGNDVQRPLVHVRLRMIGTALEQTKKYTKPFRLTAADSPLIQTMIEEWARLPLPQDTEPWPFLGQGREPSEYPALQGLGTILLSQDVLLEELEAVWNKVKTMEENSHYRGTRGFILFPSLARKFPERVDVLTQRIRRGLVSDDQEVAIEVMRGLYSWLRAAQDHTLGVPHPHADLIREIGIVIAARRQNILAEALDLARWLFKEGPEDYHLLIAEGCEHGLGYLLEEASYTRTRNEAKKSDVPLLRRNCIRLALAMDQLGYGDNAVVRNWRDSAHEDPLPEVRHALDG